MKRYNFSCYASERQEAVSRTTTTKPADFVGEARITRFRLSRGTIPIFYLNPSKHEYTDDQKNTIIASGVTPTDICFLIVQYVQYENKPSKNIPSNKCNYWGDTLHAINVIYDKKEDFNYGSLYMSDIALFCCICVAFPEPPRFEKQSNGNWILINDSYPIYDWDSLNNDTIGIKQINWQPTDKRQNFAEPVSVKLQVKEESGFPMFYVEVKECIMDYEFYNIDQASGTGEWTYSSRPYVLTTPVMFMNENALELFGMNITEMDKIRTETGLLGQFAYVWDFYAPTCTLRNPCSFYSSWINTTIDMRFTRNVDIYFKKETIGLITEQRCCNCDFTCEYDPMLITIPKDIFPVSHVLITSDEMDFVGESICVDTNARQGVIDPSNLHILKSFFVGLTNTVEIDASDFVYIDDSLTQSPVIVNNPRICSLTFRVWLLLKTGELRKCILERGKGFSLQIGLF